MIRYRTAYQWILFDFGQFSRLIISVCPKLLDFLHQNLFPYVLEALKDCRRRRRLPVELNRLDETPLIPTRSKEFYDYTYLSRYVKKIIKETQLYYGSRKNFNKRAQKIIWLVTLWLCWSFLTSNQRVIPHLLPVILTKLLKTSFFYSKENLLEPQ
jgi:hypothetical protein